MTSVGGNVILLYTHAVLLYLQCGVTGFCTSATTKMRGNDFRLWATRFFVVVIV